MSFQIIYKSLADVKIHHDYFLDDGDKKFDDLSENEKNERLSDYNIAEYLTITPVLKTSLKLKNHKISFKQTQQGFVLFANVEERTQASDSELVYCPKIQPEKELTLTFELRFSDPYFKNYTHNSEDEENRIFYFSNVRPDGEDNSLPIFFKKQDVHTKFLLKSETSRAIIHDIIVNEVAPINSFGLENIVAIDPSDIAIPENVDLLNAYIETQKRSGLIGYFQFSMNGRGNNDLVIDTTVLVPANPNETMLCLPDQIPDPILRFENRKTLWRYINVSEDETFTTKDEHPLTQNGFVELKPNDLTPRLRNVFLLNPDKENVRIEENTIYSEIFI